MNHCPSCGRNFSSLPETCPTCGHVFASIGRSESGKKLTFASILMFGATLMAVLLVVTIFTGDMDMIIDTEDPVLGEEISESIFVLVLNICGIVILSIAVVEAVCAYLAYKRRNWLIAVLGAFLGIFAIGILFISTVLSLIALVLLILSKDEFL